MIRRVGVLAIVLLATALAATYFTVYDYAKEMPAAVEDWPGRPYQSEDEWIVSQTARAVVDLARFVESGSPAPLDELALADVTPHAADLRKLTLQIGSRDFEVVVDTYVWDPDAYVSMARTLGVAQREAQPGGTDEAVTALVDLTAGELQAQNEKISAALAADVRNAAHHEAAAFLLTALAFREASGVFYDPRLVLSRASAHLAVARVLRGNSGPSSRSGELADVMLQILAGRTGPAAARMDVLSRGILSDAAATWIAAMRRRATFDWRVAADDQAPLLERLEYMRALARMLTVNASFEYLETREPEPVPDWGWRTLDFAMTVASGHAFVKTTFSQTLDEAESILGVAPQAYDGARFTAALGAAPGVSSIDRASSGRIRVIDAGTWGAFYQRHLAHVTQRGSDFYRDQYGSTETATHFEAVANRFVGDVPLWPIVRRLRARTPEEYAAAMPNAATFLRERPDAVPYYAWHYVLQRVPKGSTRIPAPATLKWFRTIFPAGTAFETRRLNVQTLIPEDFVAHADAMHELAPWDPHVTIQWSIIRCLRGCTPEQERANFARIADYHLNSIEKFAYSSSDPVQSLQRLCGISADECDRLADWMVSRDRFPEAASAYEHFVTVGRDRVRVANRVEWLVRHYQRSGRRADARRIAEGAAEVGSARGLSALAGFHERAGNHKFAADLYRRIYERYGEGQNLLAFHLRRTDASGRQPDDPEHVALLAKYFEGALRPADPVTATTAPVRGLRVKGTSWWNEKAGFRAGDVVTAVDGVQVWTTDQYKVLYDRSFEAPLRFRVWRTNGYLEVEGAFRQHYYGVELEPFNAVGVAR